MFFCVECILFFNENKTIFSEFYLGKLSKKSIKSEINNQKLFERLLELFKV